MLPLTVKYCSFEMWMTGNFIKKKVSLIPDNISLFSKKEGFHHFSLIFSRFIFKNFKLIITFFLLLLSLSCM